MFFRWKTRQKNSTNRFKKPKTFPKVRGRKARSKSKKKGVNFVEKTKEYEPANLKIIDLSADDIIATSAIGGNDSNTSDDNGWTSPGNQWT